MKRYVRQALSLVVSFALLWGIVSPMAAFAIEAESSTFTGDTSEIEAPTEDAEQPEVEVSFDDETPPEDEALPEGETPPEDETLPEGETPPEDETLPEGETPPEDEALPEGEIPPEGEFLPEEDVTGSEGTNTGVAPEGYIPENTYLAIDRDIMPLADGDTPRVLLVEDVNPWRSTANQEVLSQICEFDKVTTREFLEIDLSLYGVIVFANDQPFSTYENYQSFKEYMELFASIGGVIVFGACDAGWADGSLIEKLPGDVSKKNHFEDNNYVVDATHSIVTGALSDQVPLTDAALQSRYCSHISFNEESLPAGTKVILRETTTNEPTLIEYPLVKGRVIASGLTWEHNYDHAGETIEGVKVGNFAEIAMDDMFRYAIRVSKIEVNDLHMLDEWKLKKDAHSVIVVDGDSDMDNLAVIAGASVRIGGETYTTDENGTVFYTGEYGLNDVSVSAQNYRDKTVYYDLQPKSSQIIFMEKDKGDGRPYAVQVSGVNMMKLEYIDLRDHVLHFTEGSYIPAAVNVSGNWNGHPAGTYQLYQEGGNGQEGACIESRSGMFLLVPGQKFVYGQKVKLKLVSSDGTESEAIDLNLIIDKKVRPNAGGSETTLQEGVTQIDWIGRHTVASDNDIFTKLLTTDMSISSDLIPVEISVEHNDDGTRTLKGTLGLVAGEGTKNIKNSKKDASEFGFESPWDEFKKQIKGYKRAGNAKNYFSNLKKKYARDWHPTKFRATAETDINLLGFLEITLDENDTIVTSDGGLIVEGSGEGNFGQTFFAGPVPVYYEIKPGIGLDVNGGIEFYTDAAGLGFRPKFNGIKLELPKLSLEGGVGVRNVATAGIQGNGKLVFSFLNEDNATAGELEFGGAIHVKVIFIVDYKWDFWNTTIPLWPKNGERSLSMLPYEEAEVSLAARGYLNNQTEWNSNSPGRSMDAVSRNASLQTLQEGVMPDALPKIYQVGNDTVMLFLQDAGFEKATGNHTQLVYSVYSGGSWTEPRPVWDAGGADFFFAGAADGGSLHIAWQKSKAQLTGTEPEELLGQVSQNLEICYAVWDSEAKTFTAQQYLTNDSVMDLVPAIAVSSGTASVVWASNAANNLLETEGTYILHQMPVINGTPGAASRICETGSAIAELSAGYLNGALQLLYTQMDANGALTLCRYDGTAHSEIAADYIPSGLSYTDGAFLWQGDGHLYQFTGGEPVCLSPNTLSSVSSSYKLVSNGYKTAAVWHESGENGSVVKASFYENGAWYKPVVILEGIRDSISYMDALLLEDGGFALVLNTFAAEDETALRYAFVTPKTDLALTSAAADAASPSGSTQEVTVWIENLGDSTVTSAHLRIADSRNTYLSKDISMRLLPGASAPLTETLDLSSLTRVTDAVVTLELDGDMEEGNNTASLTLGHVNTSLAMDAYERGEMVYLVFTVANDSNTSANAALSIFEDDPDSGLLLDVKNIGTITRGESVQYVYTIDKTKADLDEDGKKTYFFRLDTTEEDWNTEDNEQFYVVSASPDEGDPGAGMRIETAVLPESISIVEGDLTLDMAYSESIQLHLSVAPADAQAAGAVWSVDDADILYVSSEGEITALSSGTAQVTASICDPLTGVDISDTITVTVVAPEHTHSWMEDWQSDETSHWHECGASDCPILRNSGKDGYGEHVYTDAMDTTCDVCGYTRIVSSYAPSQQPAEQAETYRISVDTAENGKVAASTRYAGGGRRVTLEAYPDAGYRLESITVTDTRGREITLHDLGNDIYSFIMPYARVSVSAGFIEILDDGAPSGSSIGLGAPDLSGIMLNPAAMPFIDVKFGQWFYYNVDYVWKHYLMSGVSDTRFAPDVTTSRAMIWTILARMNRVPTDAAPGAVWYEKGMQWAMMQGITDGSNAMGDITREQLAAMLWRNAGSPAGTADLSLFRDGGSVSGYALPAVRWAVANGILQGSDGKLDPQGTATRAQVAAMITRYSGSTGA